MITTKFEWREDREFGGYGWIMVGKPHFNATSGTGIAHDTIEHFRDGESVLTDELQALGAMLYIRGESSWFESQISFTTRTAAQQIGSDIGRFLDEVDANSVRILRPKTTKPLESDVENILSAILEEGERVLRAERIYGLENKLNNCAFHLQSMRGWMRIGYRRAKRRFHNAHPIYVAELFDEIKQAVDSDHKEGDIGEILTVRVNAKRLYANVSRSYQYEY